MSNFESNTQAVANLAMLMGVSQSDAQGFVDCLRVWTSKGLSVEQAIERNLAMWQTLLDNANDGATNTYSRHRDSFAALQSGAVDAFYPSEVAA